MLWGVERHVAKQHNRQTSLYLLLHSLKLILRNIIVAVHQRHEIHTIHHTRIECQLIWERSIYLVVALRLVSLVLPRLAYIEREVVIARGCNPLAHIGLQLNLLKVYLQKLFILF